MSPPVLIQAETLQPSLDNQNEALLDRVRVPKGCGRAVRLLKLTLHAERFSSEQTTMQCMAVRCLLKTCN